MSWAELIVGIILTVLGFCIAVFSKSLGQEQSNEVHHELVETYLPPTGKEPSAQFFMRLFAVFGVVTLLIGLATIVVSIT